MRVGKNNGQASFILLGMLLSLLFNWNSAYACGLRKTVHISKYAKNGEDVTVVLQELINKYSTIIIDEGTWYVGSGIRLKNGVTIKGTNKTTSIIKRKDERHV